VGTYARISADADQTGLGVARQQADTRRLVDLRGWSLGQEYVDNDLSAYRRGVIRPDFEAMLADLEAGAIQGIVVYDLDRLARQPRDLERIIEIYDRRPLVFATVQGDIDLSTPDGRTMARVMVAFANKSSMDTARRVARQKLETAIEGASVGAWRPFGWNEDRVTLNMKEAQLLRQAAQDVLNGTGLYVICRRLNEAGITTARMKKWKTFSMGRVLKSPRIAGFAVYQRELLTDSSGRPIRGKWVPILDEYTWRAVVAVLSDTKPTGGPHRPQGYLLTNIARCGLCGKGMIGTKLPKGFRYQCRGPDSGGCAKVSISGPQLHEQIKELLFVYLDKPVEAPTHWEGEARLTEVNAKLAELMEQYRTGLSGSIVFPLVRQLEAEQRELMTEQAKFTRYQARKSVTLTSEWDDMDVYAQRAVIQSVIEAIVIKPSEQRPGLYDPNRVDVIPLA
jgi:site-specific DNA recombinase